MHVLIEAILERPARPAVERRYGRNAEAPDDIGIHDVGATAVTVDDVGRQLANQVGDRQAFGAVSARRHDDLADLHAREIERRAKRMIGHRLFADGEDGHVMVAFRLPDGEPLHDALETADASWRQQMDDSQCSRPPLVIARFGGPVRL